MTNGNFSTTFSHDLKCQVCDTSISFPESLQLKNKNYLVCRSFECRRIIANKNTIAPSLFQSQIKLQKKIVNERHEIEATRKKYIEDTKERESQENKKILEYILDEYPEFHNKTPYIIEIPTGLSRPVTLPEERTSIYTAHLEKIISKAMENIKSKDIEINHQSSIYKKILETEKQFDKYPELRQISDNACKMCKGGCCTSGGDHAYLSEKTIERYLKKHPEISAADILTDYLSYTSEESIAGACINQTKKGCALPKKLRSDTCNSFYCESLITYQNKFPGQENTEALLVIQRAGTCWNAVSHIGSNAVVNIALVQSKDVQFQEISMDLSEKC